jgi:translation initiation factor 3 subunit L
MQRNGGGGGARQQGAYMPEHVRNFILYLRRHVNDGNVPGVLSLYETMWPQLTEKYYAKDPWPAPDDVKALLPEPDDLFMVLYKELYYRHINTRLNPTLAQRVYAWENYSDLFYHLLGAQTPSLELPVQWLWEIIDEFIYQYESWCQYVSQLSDKTDEEIRYLKENGTIWNVTSVIGYLEYLKAKSNIISWLNRGGERGLVPDGAAEGEGEAPDFSTSESYRMLGYFCIIGQLRLHALFRDYHLALKVLAPIELSDQGLYARVPACHVNLYYFMGFSYFMMRRYSDAINAWVSILTMVEKQSGRQDKQIARKTERMFGLLAIAISLCPCRIDETVDAKLREKHGEQIIRMCAGEEAAYLELLQKSSPRQISPSPPNFDDKSDQRMNASEMQHRFFLNEVRQHATLPTIRSYLKLYSTVELAKLSDYSRLDQEEFRMRLLALKHKSRMKTWKSGPAHSGDVQQVGEVEFCIDKDVITVSELSSAKEHHADFFLHHIDRLHTISDELGKQTTQASQKMK